jgi:aubergine
MFINVNKRVNTRLFSGDVGNYKNPLPGLTVDQGITDKDEYSFYMVSTTARQGMVTPTHYTIVYDSVKCSPDAIELLTYKLCHTYYNVSGSIKIPACVQYAHRLAALIGDRANRGNPIPPELHKRYEEELSTLFFI